MKLGLVRHFKVITDEKNFLTSREFVQAMKNYDEAPVKPNGLRINSGDWDICYCSTLPRAVKTAETVYKKEIIKSDLLVEVPISPFTKMNIKLPISIWHIAARIAWYRSHKSQSEGINETRKRIMKFYEILNNSGYERILIVAHGYFLHMFNKEMEKIGFNGDVEVNIQNGKLYQIEKKLF
ncbi:MAG: phosphoglycerate mutase family protein [Melioribacteraceae bacterium]|nr:phosphoglycerate mutase family protein [Melioribacteraceae bacterium]